MDSETNETSVARSTAMMSVLVIISRITGFIRTWAQAFALGVTVTASCYTVANNLPNQLYELIAGGMISVAFLPVYMSVKHKQGKEKASKYISNIFSIMLLITGVLCIFCFIFAAQVIWTQSFQASNSFNSSLAVWFFRFFCIEIILYGCSAVMRCILNAERDYFWPNVAPIFNNIVCIASFFLYIIFIKVNPTIALLSLAIGNPLGVLIQFILQIPAIRRHGVHLSFHINFKDPFLKETLQIGIPTLVATFVSFITLSVESSSTLLVTSSGASISYYARLWYILPYSVIAVPIITAMFTELSGAAAKEDTELCIQHITLGIKRIFFLIIPFACLLILFAQPLITILSAGKFGDADISMTVLYLSALALALPFYSVTTYLQKICSSLRCMHIFMIADVVAAGIQIAFCLLLTPFFGLIIPAISSFVFYIILTLYTFIALRRRLGNLGGKSILASMGRSVCASIVGCCVALIILRILNACMPLGHSMLRGFLYACIAGIPALISIGATMIVTHMPEAQFLKKMLKKFAK